MINFHRPVVFNTTQNNESASINQAFQQKDIWGKIQGFLSDHGDFRVKDINSFVRKRVAHRIGEDKSVSEREEIVKGLLVEGGCYIKPQEENKYKADCSEHKVDEAISRFMSGSPGLLIRGLRCRRRTFYDLKPLLGDIVPNCHCGENYYWGHKSGCYDLEADIIFIYPGSDEKIHVDLIEVKRPEDQNIKKKHVNGALEQLRKDTILLLSILKDFPKETFKIQTFIGFPDCEQWNGGSLENILLKSDLENISSKMSIKKRNDSQLENIRFLTVCARIIGRGETSSSRDNIECMIKYERNIEKQLIVLDEEQTKILNYLEAYPQIKNFAFAGGHGTGKTLMSLLVIQRLIERYKRQNVEEIYLYMVTHQEEPWESNQTLGIYDEWKNTLQVDNYAGVKCTTAVLNNLFEEFNLEQGEDNADMCVDNLKSHTVSQKVSFLMKLLKQQHSGHPVIFFLDEISALGYKDAYCWDFMHPPGSTSRYTDPGDIVNCILAFNPLSPQTMTENVTVSPTGHPRNPSNQTVEFDIPFEMSHQQASNYIDNNILRETEIEDIENYIMKSTIYFDFELGRYRYKADIGYSDKFTPSEDEANTLYLPKNLRNGFISKQLHIRYRNSEKIQEFSKFMGQEMKMYLVTSPQEIAMPCLKGEFLFWKDLGFSEVPDLELLTTTLKEMMNKIGKSCKILLDEKLPIECGRHLQAIGTIVQKSKYFRGCEADAIIYIGSGSLEAFSRPKLRLGIISCYFKLTTPTREDNQELYDAYEDYIFVGEGPSPSTLTKYNLYETYKYQDSVWGQTMVQLQALTKVVEENYEKYKIGLEKAVANNLIIRM